MSGVYRFQRYVGWKTKKVKPMVLVIPRKPQEQVFLSVTSSSVYFIVNAARIVATISSVQSSSLDVAGNLSGVISERDYITKIALLGRTSKDTKVKQIATMSAKLVTAKLDDSVEACMAKMLQGDFRHLPLVNDKGELKEKEQTIKVLSDFALGRGGHFSD
jgi:CBS domain-containing protein